MSGFCGDSQSLRVTEDHNHEIQYRLGYHNWGGHLNCISYYYDLYVCVDDITDTPHNVSVTNPHLRSSSQMTA